jgi:putative FmdB family regulatory protein
MPVYEFLCPSCHRIFSFHSFRVNTEKVPTCPKCGGDAMRRVPSAFGVQKSAAPNPLADDDALDDPRVEREMMRFASELEGMDENDPRAMAQAMRRMTELAGESVTPAMEEMMRRLEAGVDPEMVEAELGDLLDEEMGEGDDGGGRLSGPPPTRDSGLYPL